MPHFSSPGHQQQQQQQEQLNHHQEAADPDLPPPPPVPDSNNSLGLRAAAAGHLDPSPPPPPPVPSPHHQPPPPAPPAPPPPPPPPPVENGVGGLLNRAANVSFRANIFFLGDFFPVSVIPSYQNFITIICGTSVLVEMCTLGMYQKFCEEIGKFGKSTTGNKCFGSAFIEAEFKIRRFTNARSGTRTRF
jgi:hypothetical protein